MAESTDKAEVNIPNVFISDEIVEKEITYEDSTFKIKVKRIHREIIMKTRDKDPESKSTEIILGRK